MAETTNNRKYLPEKKASWNVLTCFFVCKSVKKCDITQCVIPCYVITH